jgi:hypothetical protein
MKIENIKTKVLAVLAVVLGVLAFALPAVFDPEAQTVITDGVTGIVDGAAIIVGAITGIVLWIKSLKKD